MGSPQSGPPHTSWPPPAFLSVEKTFKRTNLIIEVTKKYREKKKTIIIQTFNKIKDLQFFKHYRKYSEPCPLSYVAGAEAPLGGRSQLYAAHKHSDPRLIGTKRSMMLIPSYLTTHQSGKCPQIDHILLLKHYKTPHYPLQGGHSP